MNWHTFRTYRWGAWIAASTVFATTSCINEDLSDCGANYRISYTVGLKTTVNTEIKTQLTTEAEKAFGEKLSDALANVFSDQARDVDLSFYSDHGIAHHEEHVINSNTASYTIYLPVRNYQHLSVANVASEPLVSLGDTGSDLTYCLSQQEADTIGSHAVGLFSARMPLEIEDRDQEFHINLYMQNCTAVLMLQRGDVQPESVETYIKGMATRFNVLDSTYQFDRSPVVRTEKIEQGNYYGFYATTFPSRDSLASSSQSPAQRSPLTRTDDKGLWQMEVIVKMGGRYTRSVLSVSEPLEAGRLKLIKAHITDDGRVETGDQSVGVSVTLDWKPGGSHDIDI